MSVMQVIETYHAADADVYREAVITDALDRPVKKVRLNMTVLCAYMVRHGDDEAREAVSVYEAIEDGLVWSDVDVPRPEVFYAYAVAMNRAMPGAV